MQIVKQINFQKCFAYDAATRYEEPGAVRDGHRNRIDRFSYTQHSYKAMREGGQKKSYEGLERKIIKNEYGPKIYDESS